MSGLPLAINVLLCVVTGTLGSLIGRRAHRRQAFSDASHVLKHSPHLWLILALPVLLLGYHLTFVLKPEWEWSLPYEMQYYYEPAAWTVLIGCFTYFAGFGATIFRATRHPKRKQLGFAMLLLLLVIQQSHWRATHDQVPQMRTPRTTKDGLVFQTSPDTCVPAATASLLASLGEPRSEAEMVRLLGTDTDGTLPSQLVMAMRRLGFAESTVSVDRDGIAALHSPSVIFLRQNSHAVTLLRLDDRLGLIWDPIRGPVIMPYDGLKLYLRGGHAIHFERKTGTNKQERKSKSGGI